MFFALVFSTFVLGFFDVRRFCEDAEETSLKMPSRSTATIEAGTRGLAERVSRRLFGSCMFFAHLRQPTSGCRRVYRQSGTNLHSGWYRCVHDMHGPNGLNHSRSTSPSSPAYVAAVGHEGILSEPSSSSSPKRSDAKYFDPPKYRKTRRRLHRLSPGPSQ